MTSVMNWETVLFFTILFGMALVLRKLIRWIDGIGECADCFTPIPDDETRCEDCRKRHTPDFNPASKGEPNG